MARVEKKRLGEILLERGLISDAQLELALAQQRSSGEFLGAVMVRLLMIREEDLLTALSEQYGMPTVCLRNRYIDWALVNSFSPSLVLDYKCFPIGRDAWSVTMAIINPLDAWAIKQAETEAQGLRVKLVLVSISDMEDAITRYRQHLQRNIPGSMS
jgi:type IV pilus assembly protein PilB